MQFSGLPKDVANLPLKKLSSENGENGTIALKMPAEIILALHLSHIPLQPSLNPTDTNRALQTRRPIDPNRARKISCSELRVFDYCSEEAGSL